MKNKSFSLKLLLINIVLISLISLFLVGCERQDPHVLAKIGSNTITTDDFINRYRSIRAKMNLPDNGQVRNETFNNMVDELLLICEAESRGYYTDEQGQYEIERIRIQELINAYLQASVFTGIRVRESDLKSLYRNLNTMVKARHLHAGSRKTADSLYQKLMAGQSFEGMARQVFQDPQLRDNGGLLGYFTVDEMDPGFEESAFSLPIGKISRPVRTAQGYSIIQVLDKKTKPLLRESDYVRHRAKLEGYWLYRLKKKAAQSYSDSVRKELNISFNQNVLREYFTYIRENAAGYLASGPERKNPDNPLGDMTIVNFATDSWTVTMLQEKARFTSENQRNWIRNEEKLEDFIAGLIVRTHIISDARRMQLDRTSEYAVAVQQKTDDYLYQRMLDTINENLSIPDDSIRAYYIKNSGRYIHPPRMHLSEIVLDSEEKAREIKIALANDISFADLAQKYSVRRSSAVSGGDIGMYTQTELGAYADPLMGLETGQWTGPLQISNQFIFFKCLYRYPENLMSYEEAIPLITKSLKPIWQQRAKQDVLREIRSGVELVSYPEKLKLIQMN